MDPLTHLPTELILEIIAHLPLCSIPALRRASKGWNELVEENEDSVFRGFAPKEGRCKNVDEKHEDWKAVCQSSLLSSLPSPSTGEY